MTTDGAPAHRALLAGVVDYAGLFPPAALDMADAVGEYAAHRHGRAAWMLGRFVVPAARLDEFAATAGEAWRHAPGRPPWPVAALGGADLAADVAQVLAFNARHAGRAVVDAFEMKVASPDDVARVGTTVPRGLRVACELPFDASLATLLAALRETGGAAKFRTGGLTAAAFPSPAVLADALAATLLAGVAFKATAGLHHPVRCEARVSAAADSPRLTMHGFLNVFVGAVVSRAALVRAGAGGLGAADREALVNRLVAMLEERDPETFADPAGSVGWRGWRVDAAGVAEARRTFALSFGSCSFDDPVHGLSTLGFAP